MKLKANCLKCKFFYVTWDKTNPRGCKYFGFKTKSMPSVDVAQVSSKECGAFVAKDNLNAKEI